MLSRILVALLLIAPALHAADPKEDFDPAKIDKIILEGYYKTMDQRFIEWSNAAKKHKLAADFFAEITHAPEKGKKELREILENMPTPQLTPVSRGMQFKAGKDKFTVTYTSNLGETQLDGETINWPKGKTLRDLANEEKKSARHFGFVLPEAHAGTLGALYRWGGLILKYTTKGAIVSTAAGAASGEVVGCFYGIHTRESYESWGQGCESGAKTGVLAFTALGGASGGAAGAIFGSLSWFELPGNDAMHIENLGYAVKSGLIKAVKFLGITGMIAGAIHGLNELSYAAGANIECSRWSPGGYKVSGLFRGEEKLLYRSEDGTDISMGPTPPSTYKSRAAYIPRSSYKSTSEMRDYLKQKFSPITDKQADVISREIWAEHEHTAEVCRQNPGKTYRVRESDARKVDVPPPSPTETKQ